MTVNLHIKGKHTPELIVLHFDTMNEAKTALHDHCKQNSLRLTVEKTLNNVVDFGEWFELQTTVPYYDTITIKFCGYAVIVLDYDQPQPAPQEEPMSNRPQTINDALALWGHSTYNPEMGSLKGYALKIARYIAQVQEAPQGDVMKPFNDSLHVSIFEDATKPACKRGGFFDYEQFTDLGISHLYRLSCYKVEYAGWLPEVIMQDAIATLEAQLLSTLQALYDGSEKDFLEFKFYRERMLRRYEQF